MRDLQEFINCAQRATVVPLSEKLILDGETPISLIYRFLDKPDLFMLEGIIGSQKHDRFSYLGFDSYMTVVCYEDHVEIQYDNGEKEIRTGNLFDILQQLKKRYQAVTDSTEKYQNGLIGFLTYECVQFVENVSFPQSRELETPLARFVAPRNLVVIDNLDRSVSVIRNVFIEETKQGSLEETYHREQMKLQQLVQEVLAPLEEHVPLLTKQAVGPEPHETVSNTSREEFIRNALACKEYISSGDIFQVQISRRNRMLLQAEPIEIYRQLRHLNPSPFMFFIKFDGCFLIGASPELLVKVENGLVYHRPIAGTRKRHSATRTEAEIVQELLQDEKEIAEHVMLVDLARNDMGRVCKPGTIHVDELMGTEFYSHVIHMVSNVQGRLQEGQDAIDALRTSFPAGTVTGAPKIRAMEIITEMEKVQREFYSGGILFLDFQGNLKCALTIRTIFVKDDYCYTQAAAGMVADSVPEHEYAETENKMKACLQAMSMKKRNSA
ncbi:anthranilate synthase component I family protein [Paenibacillus hexagrammi]|uniref:Anthranilate synthase component 1 n=1 Tax=Paenibacillus hexagrammi TaxID=2908839 RepID=A0ABY3SLF4_9BACL|nr:chorismate-binding protein [Paenibacillus sp. YPD9-1]UJF34230.1 chorismate-binding protein [Paenibacillus sp. YPD9-1]